MIIKVAYDRATKGQSYWARKNWKSACIIKKVATVWTSPHEILSKGLQSEQTGTVFDLKDNNCQRWATRFLVGEYNIDLNKIPPRALGRTYD